MSGIVLDASAVLALWLDEPGASSVAKVLNQSLLSSVNFSEMASFYAKWGGDEAAIRAMLVSLPVTLVVFHETLGLLAGMMRPIGKKAGLSLGDRACLALAKQRGLKALTADRAWKTICGQLGVDVKLIR